MNRHISASGLMNTCRKYTCALTSVLLQITINGEAGDDDDDNDLDDDNGK